MTTKTVAGPFTKEQAEQTAKALGNQFSVYGVYRKDAEGYTTDECDYFVEQDTSIVSDRLFGYDTTQFLAKQYK